MPDQAISAHSSGDPTSTSLLVVVNNSTTMKTTLDEAVGFVTTAAGDMMYAAGARNMARLAVGASGTVLESTGGVPAWRTPGAGVSAAAKVYATAVLSSNLQSSGGYVVASWSAEDFDNDTLHSTSVNSSLLTIRTAGVYWFHLHAEANTTAERFAGNISEGTTVIVDGYTDSAAGGLAGLHFPTLDIATLRNVPTTGVTYTAQLLVGSTIVGFSSGLQNTFFETVRVSS